MFLQSHYLKKQLKEKIKELSKKGIDLSYTSIRQSDFSIRRIYSQALNRYGSWENAIIDAGLSYDEIRRVRGEYKPEELVEIVQDLNERGIDLKPVSLKKSPETRRIYYAALSYFDSWSDFLNEADIDKDSFGVVNNWKNGKGVIQYLKDRFEAGLVTGASNDRNFAAAAQRYFGGIPAAVEAADLIYSKSGKINKEMLKDPETIGRIYKYNTNFLEGIAKKIFFGATYAKRNTAEIEDLVNEAFIKFIEILPKKPSKIGIRPFSYKRIYGHLLETNKNFTKETPWGEEIYFDLATQDEDQEY